jgi:hypothetical protein
LFLLSFMVNCIPVGHFFSSKFLFFWIFSHVTGYLSIITINNYEFRDGLFAVV